MDHTSLLSALTTALEIAPQAVNARDDFFWPLHKAAYDPSQADQRLVRLLEQLRTTPDLEVLNGGMQVVAITAGRIDYPSNWWQVFQRAYSAVLGSGGGPAQRTHLVPPEQCVEGWGRDDDDMRRITASFVRAFAQFAGDLYLHVLPLLQ